MDHKPREEQAYNLLKRITGALTALSTSDARDGRGPIEITDVELYTLMSEVKMQLHKAYNVCVKTCYGEANHGS